MGAASGFVYQTSWGGTALVRSRRRLVLWEMIGEERRGEERRSEEVYMLESVVLFGCEEEKEEKGYVFLQPASWRW